MTGRSESKSGNRCGHSPDRQQSVSPMLRRGKGGHPPIIGRIVARVEKLTDNRSILSSWQELNSSGRRRRTEMRISAFPSVVNFLLINWFDLATRRCATPGDSGDYLQVPDNRHIQLKINELPDWKDAPISIDRVKKVIHDLKRAGYISKRKQKREQKPSGEWVFTPAVRAFTKKFFLELGGQSLWDLVILEGKRKAEIWAEKAKKAGKKLKKFLKPRRILPPKLVKLFKRKGAGKPQNAPSPHAGISNIVDKRVRSSIEYINLLDHLLNDLRVLHQEGLAPADPGWWSDEEIRDNAVRIADKRFGIL